MPADRAIRATDHGASGDAAIAALMAAGVAPNKSLILRGGFDARDQMERYVRWWRQGHWSATGHCFDIGNTVRSALQRFETTGEPYSGSTDPCTAGNGSLMRLAPVALWLARNEVQAVHEAARSSRTTHGAPACVDACRYFAALLCGALRGCPKEELLSPQFLVLLGGAALVLDYVLTIAISIASGVDALFSLLPLAFQQHKLPAEVGLIILLIVLNMRGMKEVIKVLLPIFLGFVITHAFLIVYGLGAHADQLPQLIPAAVTVPDPDRKSVV